MNERKNSDSVVKVRKRRKSKSKIILQVDPLTNKTVRTFENGADAAREIGTVYTVFRYILATGRRHKGYFWHRAPDAPTPDATPDVSNPSVSKSDARVRAFEARLQAAPDPSEVFARIATGTNHKHKVEQVDPTTGKVENLHHNVKEAAASVGSTPVSVYSAIADRRVHKFSLWRYQGPSEQEDISPD